ncbi:MAG: DNA mismatch repair protein MutT [Bacteroidetes bacterium]|nr:MAG: DNA mismatch repair protein MutT [Bacteroidota bacterium]
MSDFENPWTILGSKKVYDNNWIEVTEFSVINPSGHPGVYGKVHYKNQAIGVVPLDDEFNIFLVGQYRFPLDQYSWEIPEGGKPDNEDPLECAKRELLEETGLKAKQWKVLIEMDLSNSVSDESAIIFLARDLAQHEAAPEETEELKVKKINFEHAYEMVQRGEIRDAMSVAAILQIKLMMLQGEQF